MNTSESTIHVRSRDQVGQAVNRLFLTENEHILIRLKFTARDGASELRWTQFQPETCPLFCAFTKLHSITLYRHHHRTSQHEPEQQSLSHAA
jgi:uncharacterized protein (DUF952 family)